jgi:transposase
VILLGESMRRFVEEADRGQRTLLPECLDDFIDESNPVRVIDVFVDALSLAEMGFEGAEPAATGRPSYHPSVLLKFYIYGYLNRVQSSRRLEREAGRNVEVMWLLGRLAPDQKTIADFRSFAVSRRPCSLSRRSVFYWKFWKVGPVFQILCGHDGAALR